MRVLVTGSDGFIGRALCKALRAEGVEVLTFDVKDGDVATAAFSDFSAVDHVFHLAAMTFVPDSWKRPAEFYRVNLQGMVNVLDYCRLHKCTYTVPNSYMYGNPASLPVSEMAQLHYDVSPYHHSKGLAEEVCKFYSSQFGVSGTVLRVFNIYGPGQSNRFLIPSIIEKVLSSAPVVEVMDLEPRRDYVFVDDIVSAFLRTIHPFCGGLATYNVGSGKSLSVRDVVTAVESVWGIEKPMRAVGERRRNEIMDCYADISKIRSELDWRPAYGLRDGLARIKAEMERR